MNQFQFMNPFFKQQSNLLFNKAMALHQAGIDGDKNAVQEAFDLLEKLHNYYPQSSLLSAYYGSAMTLKGRDALDPIERLDYVRQGLKWLDQAVTDDPDNVDIRILRGYVCYRLPEFFFHRTTTSVDDFSYVISRYTQESNLFSEQFFHQLESDLASAQQTLAHVRTEKTSPDTTTTCPKPFEKEASNHEFPV